MQDNRENLAIGVLSITAIILLVGVVLAMSAGPNAAMAMGNVDRGGDYVMAAGQYTPSAQVVYLTDAAASRLNMYSYDRTSRELRLWDSHDLRKEFGPSKP